MRKWKNLLSLFLVFALLVSVIPPQAVSATETRVVIPQVELEEEILQNDVFFLGTVAAEVEESGNHAYLLRVGRGGSAETESTALIKIADLTAKYGEDYVVRVLNDSAEVTNPEMNRSLLEMIIGSDFEQQTVNDEEEYSELLENDEEAQAAYQEAVKEALDFLSDASGLTEKYDGENPYAGALEAVKDGETLTIGGSGTGLNAVQRAANLYTGEDATPQRVAAEKDSFQDLQAIANVMTNVVAGASVELTFERGETEKYLEIVPIDNDSGDGDRMFYLMLGAPKGSTTNSAASTCAVTIVDDEEQELAVVNFSEPVYTHSPDEDHVTVTVTRTGAINTVISANVKTTGSGTAEEGRDYSQVDTQLVFPFGIDHLTVDVPVRTEYLKGDGDFGLMLEADAGCVVGDVGDATVTLKGTYGEQAPEYDAQTEPKRALNASGDSLPSAGGPRGATSVNTLSTYKTLSAISLSGPANWFYTNRESGTMGWNQAGYYEMEWNGMYALDLPGTTGAVWKLTNDYWQSYFLAGAQIKWWRSYGVIGGSNTIYKVFLHNKYKDPLGVRGMMSDALNQIPTGSNSFYWPSYDNARDFDEETRYVYPSENGSDPAKQEWIGGHPGYGGDHPQYIEVLLHMLQEDGKVLKLYEVKPILRPFQVTVVNPEHLDFLQADGTRGTFTGENIAANIVGAGDRAVFFQDDTFTVQSLAGTNVRQYSWLSGLNLLNCKTGKPIYTLKSNQDPSVNTITYQLNTTNMAALIKGICPDYANNETGLWYDQLKENNYAQKTDGRATYVDFQVQPAYSYIDAKVTLRNPHTFPVTFTISGTDYTVDAGQTKIIKAPDGKSFHKGDCLAISAIKVGGGFDTLYTGIGIDYKGKYQNTSTGVDKDGSFYFSDNPTIYLGEQDQRLNFADVVIEPNLQINGNTIQVRVKTAELGLFVTEDVKDEEGKVLQPAGLLGQTGTVDGAYTYFQFAGTEETKNGQLYAISATPKNSDNVCVWYDGNTLKTYEGNTLYFKAGYDPGRNVITLTAQPRATILTLEGTLRYANFNLRTGYEGNQSNVPALGAILAAGSAGGAADKNGFVRASGIPVTGRADRWLRYLVSANGTDILQEIQIPSEGTDTDDEQKDEPVLLWDFGEDEAISASMGKYSNVRISYAGETDSEGNDYYTFTAAGTDPHISMDTPSASAESLQWAKVRARNLSGAKLIEFFASVGSDNRVKGTACTQIMLAQDTQWHEYIIHVPSRNVYTANNNGENLTSTAWTGKVNWIRLDPMENNGSPVNAGDQIQIDYVAFFENKDAAVNFRSTPGTPSVLWDFNSDEAMSSLMGDWKNQVSYYGERDELDNEYYVFTATGDDPFTTVATPANSIEEVNWVKIRAKTDSNANRMQLYLDTGKWNGCNVSIQNDGLWHEYVVNLKTLISDIGNGQIINMRVDVLAGNDLTGDQIMIDYIAFFPDEESAKAFRPDENSGETPENNVELRTETLNISSNFPQGVSPVSSPIFSDNNIQVTARMLSDGYQVAGETMIPVAYGKKAEVTVRIKPVDYEYSFTGENGRLVEGQRVESPLSVQLVVYDENHVQKGIYEKVEDSTYQSGYLVFKVPMEFINPPEIGEEPGEDEPDPDASGAYLPDPGDRIYLRLVTDRLAQTAELRDDNNAVIEDYQYSDVYTGLEFYQPIYYNVPPKMGLEGPIAMEYGDLPFVGTTGMNLNLPFVSVSITRIYKGYRLAIGLSPMQIVDAAKGTHITSFADDDGQYWKDLFSLAHPIDTFAGGIKEAANQVKEIHDMAKEGAMNGEKFDTGSLGAPTWRFDLSVGVYFDFHYFTAKTTGEPVPFYKLDGVGGYLSVTLGFKIAWYFIVPVVFIPVYLGVEIEGNVMGYLGAKFNDQVDIDYEDTLEGSVNINEGIHELDGGIRGSLYAQVSVGVGLCGTIGVRGNAKVDVIANWEPDDPHGTWGAYLDIYAGLIIDLFLFSIPINKKLKDWYWGSFDYYAHHKDTETHGVSGPEAVRSVKPENTGFRLRSGSGEDSEWVYTAYRGAFAPDKLKEQVLVNNAYERPDAQLITLQDGETLVLAFLDTENAKGAYQRTTLKMSVYADGKWSEPVAVSHDSTADFQPSIAETKDGKILVAWVSPSRDDIDESSSVQEYLRCMDVYAAFVALENGKIKTRIEDGVTVADTEVVQLSHDLVVEDDGLTGYYDSTPTVVCDLESGDANVYYVKSGRVSGSDAELANPYINDCIVCYMPFNAEQDVDTDGRIVPAGWLFKNFYITEMGGDLDNEQFLIDNFLGQRFLDGAVNEYNERYTIPDFSAISYDGKAVYAYTVDVDGDNDTDADKELYLQVYDFGSHKTMFKILLTDNDVADAMPQFFRSRVLDSSDPDDVRTHTKLFWYRDGKQVVYIDVSRLLDDCINPDGSFKTGDEYSYEQDGVTYYNCVQPEYVDFYATDSHASGQNADFKAVEDSKGNLYILWTEGVIDEEGNDAAEVFATGLVSHKFTVNDEEGNETVKEGYIGWSKSYQITREGFHNDELAVAMSGENLIAVHNRFRQELIIPEDEAAFNEEDFESVRISQMQLVADTMEPCGSVETEEIKLYRKNTVTDEEGTEIVRYEDVTLPMAGQNVSVGVQVSNNGINTAAGYKLELYAGDTLIGSVESAEPLIPNTAVEQLFDYTLPAEVDGVTFRAVTQELREPGVYYKNTDSYSAEPLKAEAHYEITDLRTTQQADSFHVCFTVTNVGNARSSDGDRISVELKGPANLPTKFKDNATLALARLDALEPGESDEIDLKLDSITPEMMADYGFLNTLVTIKKEVVVQTMVLDDGTEKSYTGWRTLSNMEYADISLAVPMNMELSDAELVVGETADIGFTMDLGDRFGSGDDTVTYAVDDLSVASIQDGKLLGVRSGETTIYATHAVTGATVSATVKVTPDTTVNPFTDVEERRFYYEPVLWAYYHEPQITSGMTETTFAPNNAAKRGQVVTFLWRAAGNPEPTGSSNPFTDVKSNAYYSKAVLWAVEQGITKGTTATTFSPEKTCTRGEFVTLLYRMQGSPELGSVSNPFEDVAEGKFYTKAVYWAVEQKITSGTSATKFSPGKNCSRGEIVTFLYRLLG